MSLNEQRKLSQHLLLSCLSTDEDYKEQLIPSNIPLVGFSEMKVKPVRSDTLPVTIDAYPQ